jgi:hypothetical protein
MFEIQHLSQLRWDTNVWNLIARHESLARCVEGMHRILTIDGSYVNPDHYRIVKRNARDKIVEVYDAYGEQTDGFLVKPNPALTRNKRRKLVAA